MECIRAEALTKNYGSARGITGLDLTVKQGEIFGYIGPNGAGKSTTIRTLLGLLKADSGRASIFGKDIVKDKTEILKSVGYMPGEMHFYSGMRVKDIIRMSARLRGLDFNDEAKQLCQRFDLDVSKKADALSLGNKKKVGIVCAFLHKPDLYVLDEPTSGLDPLMQKVFFELVAERNKAGATVFLSSHVLSEIQRYCNRAAIIREGKIIACDYVNSLIRIGEQETDTGDALSVKRVVIAGAGQLPEQLSGVKNVSRTGDTVSFLYHGDIKRLLALISQTDIRDINITDPELDEIFMHFYERGNGV